MKKGSWVFWLVTLATWAVAIAMIQAPTDRPITGNSLGIVVSAEMKGYLTPCGCAKPMVGGLTRRGMLLSRLGPQTIRLENGDLTKAAGRQDEIKVETAAEILNLLKYDAINLGLLDFKLGTDNLKSLQERFKGKILCANAVTESDQAVFARSATVVRSIAGRTLRIAIVGVLADEFHEAAQEACPEIQFEPSEAAIDHVTESIARADIRVLMVQGPRKEAERLARKYPGFHVVVSAHDEDDPIPPTRLDDGVLFSTGIDGKHVGIAVVDTATGRIGESRIRRLEADLGDDPAVVELLAIYGERVAAEGLLDLVVKSPSANGDTFAGNSACMSCHTDAATVWHGSKHAIALKTLENEKHDRDPECVGCHVVGLETKGGFASVKDTPELKHVGCESCHGPAKKHADAPTEFKPIRADGEKACRTCHVPEHSPNFDFAKYWEKIKH